MWALLCGVIWLSGCNDEPAIITDPGGGPGTDMAPMPDLAQAMDVGVTDVAPPPDTGTPGCPPPVFAPDVAYYRDNLANPIYNACSICHPAADPGPAFNLADDPALDAAEAGTFVSPRCLGNPATCDIVAWHPEGHLGYVEEPLRSSVVAWIEASTAREPCDVPDPGPEPDMAMGPPTNVPCEALPPAGAELARSEQYRTEFEAPDGEGVSHNDILVGSCARNGTCHAIAGEGDGYFLIEGNDECAYDWNFFITQLYIDLLDPPSSPLLTLPRDRTGHGGRSVFQGADDMRHVRLLRWVENEVARSRR